MMLCCFDGGCVMCLFYVGWFGVLLLVFVCVVGLVVVKLGMFLSIFGFMKCLLCLCEIR